jgi:ATP-binding cassette subfamily B (MDR/TAP) protein 1
MAKLSKSVVAEYAVAATVAEEVISSVRTAQAFGTEEKLAKQYDESLIAAQNVGYKKAVVTALLFACIFSLIYFAYGLAFCTFPIPPLTSLWHPFFGWIG